jgi:ribosomal-protein-alanine N-acetyltransferase
MINPAPALGMLRIDSAGLQELHEAMAIMNAAFDPQYGEAWTTNQCAGILPMPGVVLKLARNEHRVAVGFSLFRTIADSSELLLLAVHPHHRRSGVGKGLLQDFMSRAGKDGASQVHLEVRENNPALHLYRAAGFAPVGRRPNYYSGNNRRYDALTLARSI